MNHDQKRWAIAKVHTGAEIDVAKRLEVDGCEIYCPRYTWLFRPRGRRKPIERETAILAGYVFVNRDTISDSERIINWSDFHYFLMFNNEWALLPDAALDGMRKLEACRVLEQPQKVAMPFKVGDRVRVADGPFGGMKGEVQFTIPGRAILLGGDFTVPADMPVELLELDRD